MEQVRLGVIGCGFMGRIFLQFARQLEITSVLAVCDLDPDTAHSAAQEFGIEKVYSNADDMLKDKRIEAVILALPTNSRTQLALEAFKNGKHVLTEKPVAMNASEVRQMIEARGNLVAACCSSRYHFYESAKIATDYVAKGMLGDIRMIRCRHITPLGEIPLNPPAWRSRRSLNGGGILMNWGSYSLDYLLGILEWSIAPKTVLAQAWSLVDHLKNYAAPSCDTETHVCALILCDRKTVLSLEIGEMVCAEQANTWEIIGTEGSLSLSMVPGKNSRAVFVKGVAGKGIETNVFSESDENYDNVWTGPIRDFAEAIRQGRQPKTSLEKSLMIQKIMDAIYISAEQGSAVEII